MQARMKNPAALLPDTTAGVQTMIKAIHKSGVPGSTLELVHLRVSQINGCAWCVDAGVMSAVKSGETEDRLLRLPVWRETDIFTDAERAALALAEAATRLADRPDAVTDEIWDAAAKHFGETELAAVILMISLTNFFNRINTTIRQPAGAPLG